MLLCVSRVHEPTVRIRGNIVLSIYQINKYSLQKLFFYNDDSGDEMRKWRRKVSTFHRDWAGKCAKLKTGTITKQMYAGY